MRIIIKIILPVAFILFVIVVILTIQTPKPHIYVAFGDSISSGYGLENLEDSHPAVFFEMLKDGGYADEYVNMAQSGYTTTMLLEFLYDMDKQDLRLLKNARVVTLNIGGNNVLIPFVDYISDLSVVSGVDSVKTGAGVALSGAWSIIYEFFSCIGGISSDSIESEIGNIISGTGDIVVGTGNIITGAGEIISGTPSAFSTFTGAFSPELEAELEKGVQDFADEFTEIIIWLKANAPRATIIVNTIYNPIPQEVLKVSLDISNIAGVLIDSMNYIIIEESEFREFIVTDVNSAFSNQLNMAQFNLNPSVGDISFDIVHPNAEGHSLIAQLNYASFTGQ